MGGAQHSGMTKTLALILAAVTAGQAVAAVPMAAPREATIRYAAGDGIRDFHADDEGSIYLRERTGRWYRAFFHAPCPGVRHTDSIRVKTDRLGQFDRFGAITTYRGLCSVSSVVRSAKPAAIGRR